jgi:SAM-dependent methyltransferase
MKLKYLRVGLFWFFLRPFSERSRKRRMRSFIALIKPAEGSSVLDLGGQPMIWDNVPMRLNLVILNLPGAAITDHPSRHRIRYENGDACAVTGFDQRSFDCVFSNSVIEHVGPVNKQVEFAGEVRRLGKSYWVQTPSRWFPIEAHCGMPFWWFYPRWLRQYFIESWRIKLPAWTQMVEETTVLTKPDLRRLFPEATILIETSFGLPKSYIAYFVGT